MNYFLVVSNYIPVQILLLSVKSAFLHPTPTNFLFVRYFHYSLYGATFITVNGYAIFLLPYLANTCVLLPFVAVDQLSTVSGGMGETMEFDRSTPEMVRSQQFQNKKSCPSPRKGSKPKQDKKEKAAVYPSSSPPAVMQQQQHHLEPMNIPLSQTLTQSLATAMPPHHVMTSSREHHHSSSPRNHRAAVNADGEKKTRGRVRIRMEFISNKLRRYTTFSKRKTGIMKKVSSICLSSFVAVLCFPPYVLLYCA